MILKAKRRAVSGFTLIELLISSLLMAGLLVGGYLCLHAGILSQKLIETRVDIGQNARVALTLLTADLRSACPLTPDFEFVGMDRMIDDVESDNIDFATHHYTPQRPGEGDFCEISYFLQKNPETGRFQLWRRLDSSPDPEPLSGGLRQEIADGLVGLKFEYTDGFYWYDEWGDTTPDRTEDRQESFQYSANLYEKFLAKQLDELLNQPERRPKPTVKIGPAISKKRGAVLSRISQAFKL